MANLNQILQVYSILKPLTEAYAIKVKYQDKGFVRSELNRVLLDCVRTNYSGTIDIKLKIEVHKILRRRARCFGMIDKFYQRHLSIPRQYLSRVGSYERIGWERSDVLQELNIKMFMTIKAWARRYREFEHTGRYAPVDMAVFIRTAMVNRVKDFYKLIERMPKSTEITYATEGRIDIVDHTPNFGETVVDLRTKRLFVCGENLLEGLPDSFSRTMFMLSFMGFRPHELDRRFSAMAHANSASLPSQIVQTHQQHLFSDIRLRSVLSQQLRIVTN